MGSVAFHIKFDYIKFYIDMILICSADCFTDSCVIYFDYKLFQNCYNSLLISILNQKIMREKKIKFFLLLSLFVYQNSCFLLLLNWNQIQISMYMLLLGPNVFVSHSQENEWQDGSNISFSLSL